MLTFVQFNNNLMVTLFSKSICVWKDFYAGMTRIYQKILGFIKKILELHEFYDQVNFSHRRREQKAGSRLKAKNKTCELSHSSIF